MEAYLDSIVEVEVEGRLELFSAREERSLPVELAPEAWVITAHNPRSRPLEGEENRRRHGRLVERVRELGCRSFEALGRSVDSSWSERSLALVGLPREDALDLGAEFEQNALYRLADGLCEVVAVE